MYLVTGVAGFIGYHVAAKLLARGEAVIGIDNLNAYYSIALKRARLAELARFGSFMFREANIADPVSLRAAAAVGKPRRIIHLAAQAGVRHSLTHPEDYATANLVGHLNMLELARHTDSVELMVYASSSSVYGGNTKLPFSETDPVDRPVSLYAATKRADELISASYAHLYRIPLVGLRFFTVYGPWGRPDMAMWLFADAIMDGRPIDVFNHGDMQRDFTYVDDIVAGVLLIADGTPPQAAPEAPHKVYNIGNHRSERLTDMIGLIETKLGRTAEKRLLPMQPGDVAATYADISAIAADYGYAPTTPIEVGVPKFVEWFRWWRAQGR